MKHTQRVRRERDLVDYDANIMYADGWLVQILVIQTDVAEEQFIN